MNKNPNSEFRKHNLNFWGSLFTKIGKNQSKHTTKKVKMNYSEQFIRRYIHTVKSVLVAASSNHFDRIFDQNLLSKKWILLRVLFEGGFYLRAASNTDDTVHTFSLYLKYQSN